MSAATYDAVIVGGGFFGSYFADHLARRGQSVLLVEREPQLLMRASLVNQARIHRGYHYPRSVLTGIRSAINYARFAADFSNCVDASRPSYYAIASTGSNVTAQQYRRFCGTIGASLRPAPVAVRHLFAAGAVEEIFAVEECVFDALKLRDEMIRRLAGSGVTTMLSAEAERITRNGVVVEGREIECDAAFVCCYAETNPLLVRSGLAPVPFKHELVEMALIDVPPELAGVGVTVMCGPFFSMMPFPTRGLHTLSHVRYTPHFGWSDPAVDPGDLFRRFRRRSQYPQMVRDAARFVPRIAGSRYVDSLWEVKTLLPQSESNDSRPILYHRDAVNPRTTLIMGAKIDNVYDVCDVYDAEHEHAVAS
jgi:glycine/D-amino acid oxidase-like deaminating enzyme